MSLVYRGGGAYFDKFGVIRYADEDVCNAQMGQTRASATHGGPFIVGNRFEISASAGEGVGGVFCQEARLLTYNSL